MNEQQQQKTQILDNCRSRLGDQLGYKYNQIGNYAKLKRNC